MSTRNVAFDMDGREVYGVFARRWQWESGWLFGAGKVSFVCGECGLGHKKSPSIAANLGGIAFSLCEACQEQNFFRTAPTRVLRLA